MCYNVTLILQYTLPGCIICCILMICVLFYYVEANIIWPRIRELFTSKAINKLFDLKLKAASGSGPALPHHSLQSLWICA